MKVKMHILNFIINPENISLAGRRYEVSEMLRKFDNGIKNFYIFFWGWLPAIYSF